MTALDKIYSAIDRVNDAEVYIEANSYKMLGAYNIYYNAIKP